MNRIKYLRERNEYTQQKIADYLGISKMTYIRYENGNTKATAGIIVKLADLYNISTDFLLGRSNVGTPFRTDNDAATPNATDNFVGINGLTIEEEKQFYDLVKKIKK